MHEMFLLTEKGKKSHLGTFTENKTQNTLKGTLQRFNIALP